MNIELNKDLIEDDRGNLYRAVQQEGNTLVLVNAFVEASFREVMNFEGSDNEQIAAYQGEYIGKPAMDLVRHDYVYALQQLDGRLYSLQDTMKNYDVTFIKMIEFFRPKGN
ncbi:hypothetical protein [Paenibacillus sp. Marseille-Q4541]|uniref:hypothetical protein n=1 Tax=Paenibacillus sp. Marseille-Q4541 TaxID=2831522 RepID=UPI001BA6D840|nr:hypothetical protein [Paenibacillus sp. Marseille-Q4541]